MLSFSLFSLPLNLSLEPAHLLPPPSLFLFHLPFGLSRGESSTLFGGTLTCSSYCPLPARAWLIGSGSSVSILLFASFHFLVPLYSPGLVVMLCCLCDAPAQPEQAAPLTYVPLLVLSLSLVCPLFFWEGNCCLSLRWRSRTVPVGHMFFP